MMMVQMSLCTRWVKIMIAVVRSRLFFRDPCCSEGSAQVLLFPSDVSRVPSRWMDFAALMMARFGECPF